MMLKLNGVDERKVHLEKTPYLKLNSLNYSEKILNLQKCLKQHVGELNSTCLALAYQQMQQCAKRSS